MTEMFGRYSQAARRRQNQRILDDWQTCGVCVQKDATGRLYVCPPHFLIAREADEYGALTALADAAQPGGEGVMSTHEFTRPLSYSLIAQVEQWRAAATERLTLDASEYDAGNTIYVQLRDQISYGIPVDPELLGMFGNWRTLRYYQNPDDTRSPIMATNRSGALLGFTSPMSWNREPAA